MSRRWNQASLHDSRTWLDAVHAALDAAGIDRDVFGSDDLRFMYRRRDSPTRVVQMALEHVSAERRERRVR